MAMRKRSKDGKRETDEYLEEEDREKAPSRLSRSDGNLERKVGTRDLLKKAEQARPGATRVRKSDKLDDSDPNVTGGKK